MAHFLKRIFGFDEDENSEDLTIFHVTHYKAGSQWVYAVLSEIARERIVTPEIAAEHYTRGGIIPGKIYPCVYLTKKQFKAVERPKKNRSFIVLRDLRDTLVSQYFSVKSSHEMLDDRMKKTRNRLNDMSQEEGLMHIMNNNIYSSARIQRSWFKSRWARRKMLIVRYEDLIEDEYAAFNKIFDHCGFVEDEEIRRSAIESHSFERQTGRKPGQEDTGSHHRKGISGDWKNYFDDKMKDAFKKQFNRLLIDTGYEKDDSW